MALLCVAGSATAEKKFIASSSGAKITIAEETNGPAGSAPTVKTLNIAPTTAQGESVVAMTVSCQGQLLAVCTSEKRLVVWECQHWRVRGERTVAKRVTSLQFSESAEHILAADRAGEVTRYCVTDLSTAGEELLGHLSMLLDMVMVSHDSHVITCDRDEKIRVSKYPNSYNIETYCLGHTEKWPHILISSSGDGTVKTWDWMKGQLLDSHHCSHAEKEPVAVTQVVCTRNRGTPLVVASLEGTAELVILQLSSDGKIECLPSQILLPVHPWSSVFDWEDRLCVCLPHEQDPMQCWACDDSGEFQRCSNPLQECLSSWEFFKECKDDRDWSTLRKHTFDNVADYLERKEQRIRQKTQTVDTREIQPLSQPPEKRLKLHLQTS